MRVVCLLTVFPRFLVKGCTASWRLCRNCYHQAQGAAFALSVAGGFAGPALALAPVRKDVGNVSMNGKTSLCGSLKSPSPWTSLTPITFAGSWGSVCNPGLAEALVVLGCESLPFAGTYTHDRIVKWLACLGRRT